MISPFPQRGEVPSACEAIKGVFPRVQSVPPPHPPFGHLLPAGEKRENADGLCAIFLPDEVGDA